MLPELTQEEFSAALDRAAREVIERVGMAAPPLDAFALAARLGLRVAVDAGQPERGKIVRLKHFSGSGASGQHLTGGSSSGGSILLRPEPRSERLQWAVAHEVGETLAARVFEILGVDPREAPANAREGVANQLAARLLLPVDWFQPRARRLAWNLFELKREFATASHELIARRMLDFEPAVVVTVVDNGRVSWRRGNMRFKPAAMSALERRCWEAAHATGEPQADEDRAHAVEVWPVHEEGWQREILRTELRSGDDDCQE